MIDLGDVTFMFPVSVEHEDRLKNARTVLGFLNHHFRTKVSIVELAPSKLDFLSGLKNLDVRHVVLKGERKFHRTRYLNMMLEEVETPVVVNHDLDVVLHPSSYGLCRDAIVKSRFDVVYPYGNGDFQVRVPTSFDHESFRSNGYDVGSVFGRRSASRFGHCLFAGTDHYRRHGGENEGFVSYGPEDVERARRFWLVGSKMAWTRGLVFHFEHFRGPDSSSSNVDFSKNLALLGRLKNMTLEEFFNYYSSADYLRSYLKVCWRPSSPA